MWSSGCWVACSCFFSVCLSDTWLASLGCAVVKMTRPRCVSARVVPVCELDGWRVGWEGVGCVLCSVRWCTGVSISVSIFVVPYGSKHDRMAKSEVIFCLGVQFHKFPGSLVWGGPPLTGDSQVAFPPLTRDVGNSLWNICEREIQRAIEEEESLVQVTCIASCRCCS
jgi:hypothetical protein